MKKIAVVCALIILFALCGCTRKECSPIDENGSSLRSETDAASAERSDTIQNLQALSSRMPPAKDQPAGFWDCLWYGSYNYIEHEDSIDEVPLPESNKITFPEMENGYFVLFGRRYQEVSPDMLLCRYADFGMRQSFAVDLSKTTLIAWAEDDRMILRLLSDEDRNVIFISNGQLPRTFSCCIATDWRWWEEEDLIFYVPGSNEPVLDDGFYRDALALQFDEKQSDNRYAVLDGNSIRYEALIGFPDYPGLTYILNFSMIENEYYLVNFPLQFLIKSPAGNG